MAVRPSWLGFLSAAGAVSILMLAVVTGGHLKPARGSLVLELSPESIPADGVSTSRLKVWSAEGFVLAPTDLQLEIVDGARGVQIALVGSGNLRAEAVVRAGVSTGPVIIEARAEGFAPARARLDTVLDPSDRAGDGTPDFLRLDDEADRKAFRSWFTFVAEQQFYRSPDRLPTEIRDCASLIRFAYREALRGHDGSWASELGLDAVPGAASVAKYNYPFTPLGATLFRVRSGPFRAEDLSNGAFAQFADAQTLYLDNTFFVSRDFREARPGDLLFFRQLEQNLPFHAMIFLGLSQFEPGPNQFVVYHTGAIARDPGEIRRPSLHQLLTYPLPRWRPILGNSNFLGIYRWNVLREAE